ncbi:MAG: CoA-transferase subunit beta [Anaerolineales bacterium]
MNPTSDEIMVVCMARQLQDGELVVQGLATPLVTAAFLLARHTHAPRLHFASAIGQSLCREPAPLSLTNIEALWLERALMNAGFSRVATEILPTLHPKEFFRPAQVDTHGNFNNLAFGKDYHRPRMRLPGSGGIPDVSLGSPNMYLYVPRHSRLTFVERLDFRSGLGHAPERTHGNGPIYLVSDLGQFDFQDGHMRLLTWHPGSSPERIQKLTGFPLPIAPHASETPLPDRETLALLRHEIDPLGIRRLEVLNGAARRDALREILQKEHHHP